MIRVGIAALAVAFVSVAACKPERIPSVRSDDVEEAEGKRIVEPAPAAPPSVDAGVPPARIDVAPPAVDGGPSKPIEI